jgi:hypothetical protein
VLCQWIVVSLVMVCLREWSGIAGLEKEVEVLKLVQKLRRSLMDDLISRCFNLFVTFGMILPGLLTDVLQN